MTDPAFSKPDFRRPLPSFAAAMERPSAWFGVLAALFVLFACQMGTTPETNNTFSFPTLKEKIGEADEILIVLKDSSGNLVDVLFEGPVDSNTRFDDLKAPNYSGGKVYIHIEATKDGQTLYKVQRGYDPARGGDIAQETIVYVDPTKIPKDTVPNDTTVHPRLRLQPDTLVLALRGPTGRFTIEFLPATSAGTVIWSALDPGVELSADGFIAPKAQGVTRVIATAQANATAKDTAWVKVLPVQAVDSLRFEKRTTTLLVHGSSDSLRLRVYPPLAPSGSLLTVRDTSMVRLVGGALQGRKEGETKVYAYSQEDPTKRDSLAVVVLSPRPADSVRIQLDTLKLFVKGPGQLLAASIYPADLAPLFLWSSQNPALATVDAQGMVTPVSQGQTQIVVRSWADSTKEDRAIVLVKKDTPRILGGNDTILAKGATLIHTLSVTQEFGQVAMFKWDLDGNGDYEDSATAVRAGLSHIYAEAKEYVVRFYVRDTEGNDTVQVRHVKAVYGRVVQITSPKDGSSTNAANVTVSWTVDGVAQNSNELLRAGANIITRSAQDSAGNTYSHSVTVFLDQAAPQKPTVTGPALPINYQLPRWSWKSGDTSGSGTFRYRLDTAELASAPTMTDTVYIASANLAEGLHTLYVQERDAAGNWSASGSFTVRIDLTGPAAPTVQAQQASPTNESRPTWTWSGAAGNVLQYYRFKLDDNDFRTGARDTLGTGFRPSAALSEGNHTLYVQVRDSAGNWSTTASAAVTVDITPPAAPRFDAAPYSPLNSLRPRWTWRSGGGGARRYRASLSIAGLSTAVEQTDSSFTPAADLTESSHTLHVQERDAAGNWSTAATKNIVVSIRKSVAQFFSGRPEIFAFQSDAQENILLVHSESGGDFPLLRVRRYNGNEWLDLGDPSSLGRIADRNALAISRTGTPYLVMEDSLLQAFVAQLSGNRWTRVGNNWALDRFVFEKKVAISNTDVLYVAYSVSDETGTSNQIVIKRLNGQNWEIFSTKIFNTQVHLQSLSVSSSGVLIISYLDANFSPTKIVVQKVNSGSAPWENIGSVTVYTYRSIHPVPLVQTIEDSLYIALREDEGWDKNSVHKFNGSNWVPLGELPNSEILNYYPLLTVSPPPTRSIYFAYNKPSPQNATIRVFRDNQWAHMAELPLYLDFQSGLASGKYGVPYVAATTESHIAVWKASFDP